MMQKCNTLHSQRLWAHTHCHAADAPHCPPALYRPPTAAAPAASWLALVMTQRNAAAHQHVSKHQDHACSNINPRRQTDELSISPNNTHAYLHTNNVKVKPLPPALWMLLVQRVVMTAEPMAGLLNMSPAISRAACVVQASRPSNRSIHKHAAYV